MTRTAASLAPSPLSLRSVSRSHPGLRRRLNEDRVLERPGAGVWAVADGMGGHRDGDIAASRLIETLASLDPQASGYARLAEAASRLETVNSELFDLRGQAGPIGATLVLLLAEESHFACMWAGDSRAYLLRDGALVAITRDHSLVEDLVSAGLLDADQRRNHPRAHIVTRAVGAAPHLELDRRFAAIRPGDVFLLCSDGLTDCLTDRDIRAAITPHDLDPSADRLIALALEYGAPDNVSLVLVHASVGEANVI